MKKWLTVLAVLTCVFGLTACGSKAATETENPALMSEADAIAVGENLVNQMAQIVASGQIEAYKNEEVYYTAFEGWQTAMKDMGSFEGFLDESAEVTEDGLTVTLGIDGSERDATVVVMADENGALTSITTNVKYTLPELMEQAGLNTVLGMGTTFAVLILISLVISLFPLLNKSQAKKKAAAPAAAPAPAPAAPAAEPVAETTEENDETLIAVIAAAIAASEGRATTDGFVVRSIRKSSKRSWKF